MAVALSAVVAHGHGALDERIARLKEQVAQQPAKAELRVQLAEVQILHEEHAAALVELEQAERLAPGEIMIERFRGEARLALGQPAEARRSLDKFLAAQPGHARALALRARALLATGEAEAGLADYRAALRVSRLPEAALVSEAAVALADQGHADEAVAVLAAGIGELGPVPTLLAQALELESATGRFDAALGRVDALQKSAAMPEVWMARRASLLGQAGRPDEARAAWQSLLSHIGQLPNLRRGSGLLRDLTQQAQRALAALPSVSALSPHTSPPAS